MQLELAKIWRKIPSRLAIGLMSLTATFMTYFFRANLSMNLLAMVEPTANNNQSVPDYGPRYPWSPVDQSLLLGGYFYGSAAFVLPIGYLMDRYGYIRLSMCVAFVIVSCVQLLSPLAASWSLGAMVALRVISGVVLGVLYPALHRLFSQWAPPNELGKFTGTMIGGNIGTIASWSLSGFLITSFGWQTSFYVTGGMVAVFALVWWLVVHDTPGTHPRITIEEREYIEQSVRTSRRRNKKWPPIGKMLTSLPVWTIILLQYGNLWGIFFNLTAAPKFINTVLGFQLTSTGLLASLPYICRLPVALVSAQLCDYLRGNNVMSLLNIRRIFTIISHVLPGIFLIVLPYVSYDPYYCIACMAISFGLNGAVSQSVISMVHDSLPQYVLTLTALANTIANTSGFLSPILVAFMTAENNSIEEWRNVFLVGAAFYIIPAVFFLFFGSSTELDWGRIIEEPVVALSDDNRQTTVAKGSLVIL